MRRTHRLGAALSALARTAFVRTGPARTALAWPALALSALAMMTFSIGSVVADDRARLEVFAAASLSDAFREIGKAFETEHPGVTVRFNFAGSQILARQIEQGAAADVFASADPRWMDFARERGLVTGTPRVFARNRLVVVTPSGNPARIKRLQDLARPGVKIVIAADAVPAGAYARAVIANLAKSPGFPKGYERRVHANVVSQEENVRAVVGKIQLGEADAGFVYRSDVGGGTARFVRVFDIAPQSNVIASYPIAALGSSRSRDLAQEFCSFVLAPGGRATLERNGFLAPDEP